MFIRGIPRKKCALVSVRTLRLSAWHKRNRLALLLTLVVATLLQFCSAYTIAQRSLPGN